MRRFLLAAAAACVCAPGANAALLPGDIAFTGFNADGLDGFTVVALSDVAAGEVVYFRDDEWDGSAFGTGEGEFIWTTSTLSAGSVIEFVTDNGTPTATAGTITVDAAFGDGSMGISSGGETIFAFQGASNTPATFLAAIGSDGSGIQDSITGTGLTVGVNAIELVDGVTLTVEGSAVADGPDIAEYVGPKNGEVAFADYLSLVNDPANWLIQQGGSGDQSIDQVGPDAPFGTDSFSVVPEPTSVALAAIGCLGLLGGRRR